MNKQSTNNNKYKISKSENMRVVFDMETQEVLYQHIDTYPYRKFNIKNPVLSGIGSICNIPGNYYKFCEFHDTDAKALLSDWNKVGADIFDAIELFSDNKELREKE
ncbi:hypothetical protein EZS27_023291 [termite gut metagenome]|uniref:Uncharacterized protein n=1 Tax=termite gut metagenome TaxID=433724 RepID=A0A5J4R1I6_9ZZZZ